MNFIFAMILAFFVFSFVAGSLIVWAHLLPFVLIYLGVPSSYYIDLWACSAFVFFGIAGRSGYLAFKRVRPSNELIDPRGKYILHWSNLRVAFVIFFLCVSLALSHSTKMVVDKNLCSNGKFEAIPAYVCQY